MIYTVLRSTAGVAHNKRGGYLIMVAGHLREKKGYFYAVLNYTDAHGNRKTKWIATGLAVKGNKKRAEAFLQEQRRSFLQVKILDVFCRQLLQCNLPFSEIRHDYFFDHIGV